MQINALQMDGLLIKEPINIAATITDIIIGSLIGPF